jgi:hypothetical protein
MATVKTAKKSSTRTATTKSATTAKPATKSTKTTTTSKRVSSYPTVEHTFENGVKVSGTLDQLVSIAKAMGLTLTGVKAPSTRGFYPSESKGLIKISEMNEYHIRRSLLKRSKDYFTEIFVKEDTNTQFLSKFTKLTEDSIIVDLYNELASR